MKIVFLFILTFLSAIGNCQDVPFNKNYQVACHNCYMPEYNSLTDVFSFTKAIEIDIWDNFQGSGSLLRAGKKMNQDWFVKHDFWVKGNLNCCGGSFRDCLLTIKKWADIHKDHDIITVFIDKKENWSESYETRKPKDFDELICSVIGKQNILTPSILLADKTNLKEAVLSNYWPLLDSLKGKFIFVITNGSEFTDRNPLNEYLFNQNNEAVCFVAPEITSESEIKSPLGVLPKNAENIIFYNLNYKDRNLAININSIGCISRVFNLPIPETSEAYAELNKDKVNFIVFSNLQINKQ